MINRITLLCAILSIGTIASAQQAAQPQGLLSRLRGEAPSTRQQLQNEPRQIAQPANSPQGYAPGVTFPQAQQQQRQPQPSGPVYPAYPPQAQNGPYNLSPQTAATPQATATPRPTQTPARTRSTSNDEKEESSRSSSSRSRTGASRSSSSDSDDNKSNSSSRKAASSSSASSSSSTDEAPAKKTETAEMKSEASTSSENESSSAKSPSALQKIVKKVESGKEDENEAAAPAEPKKTKEEIEAEKVREVALKSADKATTVVASFLKLANDGYYSKASDHLAPAIRKYFESEISAVNGTQKIVLDELTAHGTITMVTYVNTTVRGEGAIVEAELGYENGRTARRSFDLIELEKEWKIVLPVTDSAVANSASVTASAQNPTAPAAASAPATAPATLPPPTPEQAAASAAAPMVLAPGDPATTAPPQ